MIFGFCIQFSVKILTQFKFLKIFGKNRNPKIDLVSPVHIYARIQQINSYFAYFRVIFAKKNFKILKAESE